MIAALAFALGALIVWLIYRFRRANDRIDWILLGQAQAELEHGWHQPVDGTPMPRPLRRRSPDEQFVTRPPVTPDSIVTHQSR